MCYVWGGNEMDLCYVWGGNEMDLMECVVRRGRAMATGNVTRAGRVTKLYITQHASWLTVFSLFTFLCPHFSLSRHDRRSQAQQALTVNCHCYCSRIRLLVLHCIAFHCTRENAQTRVTRRD
jgi:hypothetical protein